MTTKTAFVESVRRDAARVAEVVRAHSTPPIAAVPSCPGWNLTFLLLHLGRNHRLVISRLRSRDGDPASLKDTSFLKLESPWLEWLNSNQAPGNEPIPAGLVEWFEAGAAELTQLLEEIPGDAQVWNFTGQSKIPATFYQRQMAVETTLHRWDAQNAVQAPDPVDPEIALDAINLLFQFLPMRRKNFDGPPGQGETFHFHRTDGEGEWLLTFNGKELDIKQTHAKGDIALRGSASDLLLFLWGRVPADKLEIFGNAALAERYFELLPKM